MRSRAGGKASLVAVVACLATTADASAAQRFAAAGAAATAPCTAAAPCRLDAAVERARAGDEIVVVPGDYAIAGTLDGKVAVDLHGVAGEPRPRLIGGVGLDKPVVALDGGSVRHLEVRAGGRGVDADALRLRSGLGEDLVLGAADGDGAEVDASAAGTVLRDSVVTTAGTGPNAEGVELRGGTDAGDRVRLINLTVLATGGQATGVYCAVAGGSGTIVNSYVRGARADIDATASGRRCFATASDFGPALSPGLAAGAGNVSDDAVFADAAAGDLRTLAGSPTIDAGTPNAPLGTSDAAGCPRSLGAAPDIGAFEYAEPFGSCGVAVTPPPVSTPAPPVSTPAPPVSTPAPPPPTPIAPSPSPAPASPAPAPASPTPAPTQRERSSAPPEEAPTHHGVPVPHVGSSVVVSVPRGKVRVRVPHARHFRRLDGPMRVPVGSTVDATHGRVRLVSAINARGTRQLGTFWGTRFRVRQRRHDRGMTTLQIAHAAACRHRRHAGAGAVASAARHHRRGHRHRKHRRSLWAHDDHGRFRTRGSSSVATARGTAWVTQERCTGTFTRVTKGAVAVRDRVRHKTVVVRAGHSYLARRRG